MGKLELRTFILWQPIGRLRVLRHPNQPADAIGRRRVRRLAFAAESVNADS